MNEMLIGRRAKFTVMTEGTAKDWIIMAARVGAAACR
jgi:hypothetical protein